MAKFERKTNYREKYPCLSDEIIEVLVKSDRKMEYQQYDLKVERCRTIPKNMRKQNGNLKNGKTKHQRTESLRTCITLYVA